MDWRDIKSCPLDGEFLVWDGEDRWLVSAGHYAKGNGCGCCESRVTNITHWSPIPEPPND